ncbi:Transcription repressor [Abeliophyllum distichum]|uniref:Transcription repressor n=1 Tax=Abeliophyllum distichum TaxID=126358 RepID=A0ABD1RAZ2_9LAMI
MDPKATRLKFVSWPGSQSFSGEISPFDFDDSSPKYTSLKEILATSNPRLTCSCIDIPIRNPLVKQAAWFYLQPMPAAMKNSSKKCLVCRIVEKMPQDLKHSVKVFLRFVKHVVWKIRGAFRRN